MDIRPIEQNDRKAVDDFIISHWFTMQMVVHGESIDLGIAEGWYAAENGNITGLITYRINGDEMEVLSLDSVSENRGIGTALLNKAVSAAGEHGLSRVMLITTNDNLNALRFYQKRGFDMVRLYRNALDRAREIKPSIPAIGNDGIPLRHEIELELIL